MTTALSVAVGCVVCAACLAAGPVEADAPLTGWLFFASDGRLGAIQPNGTGECYPAFSLPSQRKWRIATTSTCTSPPCGRRAVSGCCTSAASTGRTPATIAPTSASAERTARSIAC